VWLGGFVFLLGLGPIFSWDALGWVVKMPVWIDFAKCVAPASDAYKGMSGATSSLLTYFFLLVITSIGVIGMGGNLKKYIVAFTLFTGWCFSAWCSETMPTLPPHLTKLRD